MKVNEISIINFNKYGRIYNFELDIDYINSCIVDNENDVVYCPNYERLYDYEKLYKLGENVFGCMDIQIGYCSGANYKVNALEYHKSSELIVAVTDIVICCGHVFDIEDGQYSLDKLEFFTVKKGTIFEFYSTTLHFAPMCYKSETFKTVVALPKGTNHEITEEVLHVNNVKSPNAVNNWLLTHSEFSYENNALVGINYDIMDILN